MSQADLLGKPASPSHGDDLATGQSSSLNGQANAYGGQHLWLPGTVFMPKTINS